MENIAASGDESLQAQLLFWSRLNHPDELSRHGFHWDLDRNDNLGAALISFSESQKIKRFVGPDRFRQGTPEFVFKLGELLVDATETVELADLRAEIQPARDRRYGSSLVLHFSRQQVEERRLAKVAAAKAYAPETGIPKKTWRDKRDARQFTVAYGSGVRGEQLLDIAKTLISTPTLAGCETMLGRIVIPQMREQDWQFIERQSQTTAARS